MSTDDVDDAIDDPAAEIATGDLRDHLDEPRRLMYDELAEQIGGGTVEAELASALNQHITRLYDNRDQIERQ